MDNLDILSVILMSSDTIEPYKVLLAIYSITKGLPIQPIIVQVLPESLGFSMDDQDKYQQLIEHVNYLANEFLLRYERNTGLVITKLGIDEIENSLLEPHRPSNYFTDNIKRFVEVDESLIEFIRKMRKARKDYLVEVFQTARGFETAIVSPFEIKEKLKLDDDTFKRVYYYLIKAGFIKRIHSNGISVTHMGKLEIENTRVVSVPAANFWQSKKPDVTYSDDLAIALDKFNTLAKDKLGLEIFKNNAKLYSDLRRSINYLNKDSRNKDAFVSCVLSTVLILGDVYASEIRKKISNKEDKSIKLIQELFNSEKIKYEEQDFNRLKKLVKLRSATPPVHVGEVESIEIFESIGIKYPPTDWAAAAEKYLKSIIEVLNKIADKLK
jgi:hypothetical protein